MSKGFTRQIISQADLAPIASTQIQTAPAASVEPVPAPEPGKRGRPHREVKALTFNLRLPADIVEEIDRRRGDLISRNAWISLAVADKLKHE